MRDVDSGKSLAGLYSLVATCESRAINPRHTRRYIASLALATERRLLRSVLC